MNLVRDPNIRLKMSGNINPCIIHICIQIYVKKSYYYAITKSCYANWHRQISNFWKID